MSVVLPDTRSASISWLLAVSYATRVALTNCGLVGAGSKWHRVLAFAGSWRALPTTAGPPARRLRVEVGLKEGAAEAPGLLVAGGLVLDELFAVEDAPPHAEKLTAA